jgi:hypothetical protein
MIAPHTITASGGLEITVHRDEATTIVALKGRIDIDSSPPLRDRLLALLQETSRETVIVDLGNVLYIDSSGIATRSRDSKWPSSDRGSSACGAWKVESSIYSRLPAC